MRRKKDDKRVLRSGNGRQQTSRRRRRNNRNNRQFVPHSRNRTARPKKQKKTNKKLVFIMIIALIAFVIGAGIGISLSFDNGDDGEPKFENVTKEMTSNLNDTQQVYYEKEVDDIDFNENTTSPLDIQYEYSNE